STARARAPCSRRSPDRPGACASRADRSSWSESCRRSRKPLENAIDFLRRQIHLVAIVDLHHRRTLARTQALDGEERYPAVARGFADVDPEPLAQVRDDLL